MGCCAVQKNNSSLKENPALVGSPEQKNNEQHIKQQSPDKKEQEVQIPQTKNYSFEKQLQQTQNSTERGNSKTANSEQNKGIKSQIEAEKDPQEDIQTQKDTVLSWKKNADLQPQNQSDQVLTVTHQTAKPIKFPEVQTQKEKQSPDSIPVDQKGSQIEKNKRVQDKNEQGEIKENQVSVDQIQVLMPIQTLELKPLQSNIEEQVQQTQQNGLQELQGDTIVNDAEKNQKAEWNNQILTNEQAQQFYHMNNLHNEPPNWKFFKSLLISYLETTEGIRNRRHSISKALDNIIEMESYKENEMKQVQVQDTNLLFENYVCNIQWIQNLKNLPIDLEQILELKVVEENKNQNKKFLNKNDIFIINKNGLKGSNIPKNEIYIGKSGDIQLHPQDTCDDRQLMIKFDRGYYYLIDQGTKYFSQIKIIQNKPLILRKGLIIKLGIKNIFEVKEIFPNPDVKNIDLKKFLFIEFENEQQHTNKTQSSNQISLLKIQFMEGERKNQELNICFDQISTIGRSSQSTIKFDDQEISQKHGQI